MKIVQQTPTELTLRLRPVGIWTMGGIFAAAGLLVMAGFGRLTTLTCRRVEPTQGSCELAESGLLGAEFQEVLLTDLWGAEVETSSGSDGNTYRVVLLTSNGDIPFKHFYSSGHHGKQETAFRINTFVENPGEASLAVRDDDRWFAYSLGGAFVAAGLFMVYVGQVVTCHFNKTLGSMTIKRQGLLGTKVTEHFIRQILDVWVEESTDSDGSTYRVSFKLKSGDRLPLTSYYSSGKGDKQQTADHIRTFLNLSR